MSKMKLFSIGIAAENKKLDSHELRVVPIEVLPMGDGDIVDSITETDVTAEDASEKEYTVKIKQRSALKATWIPVHGSNRTTSPNVRRGERLLIWQYGDTDKYYWSPTGLDDDLRRLETVIYAWSATKEEYADLKPGDNMYSLEVSTHGKHITLHTTQADGEPFEYTIQLDTKNGKFLIADNDNNSIHLDSAERIITAKNRDKTEVTLDKKTIYAYSKDLIQFHCDGKLDGYVKKEAYIHCDGPYTAKAPEMQFGEDDAVEPSVLGDTHGDGHKDLEKAINESQVIGNLGIKTSAIQAVKKIDIPSIKKGGASYSKVNTNQ